MNLNHLTGRHALGWLTAAQASGQDACDQSGRCLMLLAPCLVYDNSSWYQISSCPASGCALPMTALPVYQVPLQAP